MRNMAVLHSPAFSYPLPVLVRVLFNLLIFKGKILYYNKYIDFKSFIYNDIIKKKEGVSKCTPSVFYAQSPDFHKLGLCYYLKILYL